MKHVVHGPPWYFTPDWEAAAESVRRLADLRPRYAITGHGPAVADTVLAHDLHLLSTRFRELAVPPDGRYVRHPARTDERGTVWLPPKPTDWRPQIIGGLAVGAALVAITAAMAKRRDA
jgi:glyoxylase-like metal-dependent hydrolase (beta-lactamase superfamily II)